MTILLLVAMIDRLLDMDAHKKAQTSYSTWDWRHFDRRRVAGYDNMLL